MSAFTDQHDSQIRDAEREPAPASLELKENGLALVSKLLEEQQQLTAVEEFSRDHGEAPAQAPAAGGEAAVVAGTP